jgi:predicted small lipoprotein YifL
MRARRIALVLLICAAAAACGKKSSLYLEPGKPAPAKPPAVAPYGNATPAQPQRR